MTIPTLDKSVLLLSFQAHSPHAKRLCDFESMFSLQYLCMKSILKIGNKPSEAGDHISVCIPKHCTLASQ
jgi:hypothetical protein